MTYSLSAFGSTQRNSLVTSIAQAANIDEQLVGVADVEAGDGAGDVKFELRVFTDSVSRLEELAAAGAGSCPRCDKFDKLNALVESAVNATLSAPARVKTVDFACVSCGRLVI
jgi:hypothetical protein